MGNVENVSMVKESLTEAINEVCKEKEKYSIVENAFIRNRELPLPKLIEDILLFENKSIEKSLLGNHQFSNIYSNLIMHNFCRVKSSFAEVKKKIRT